VRVYSAISFSLRSLAAKILGLDRGDTINVSEGDGGIRKRCRCRKARQIRLDIYDMRCITDIR